jgi:hypothetical protein
MRLYTSIVLLSLVTILVPVDSQFVAYGSTPQLQPAAFGTQLTATQTQTDDNPSPDRGSNRRAFYHWQKIRTLQIYHRGSGRREIFL